MDFDKVLALIDAMNREGVDYALFGALALAAHGLVRATEDADFFINPSEENVERLKRALKSIWDDPSIDQIDAHELAGDYPAVAYWPAGEDFGIDFVARLGEAFAHDTVPSEQSDLDGVPVRVVTKRCLYDMKRDTVRYKDRIDADALRRDLGLPEE
jgi:hypothetical protein